MRIKKEFLIEGVIKHHTFTGKDKVIEFCEKHSDGVLVYFDPDIDGMISGLLVCRFMSALNIPFSWYVNSNRQHGFKLGKENLKGKGILCVDFGITDKELKEIVGSGCDLLSIDHHECGDTLIECSVGENQGYIINNQYGFEEETGRYLSGAGVVFEVLISLYPEFNTLEHRALVGVTLLSDVRNIENINARLYLQDLYEHPYRGYIKYLIDATIGHIDYTFGLPRLDRNYVDFTFSPTINSCLRFNQENEVVEFFLGSGVLDKGAHKRQIALIEEMKEKVGVVEMDNLIMLCIDGNSFVGSKEESFLSNFVGLLASRYLDGEHSIIAYLIIDEKLVRASLRGRYNGVDYLGSLSTVLEGAGHGGAFGIMSMGLTMKDFEEYNRICGVVEEGEAVTIKYKEISNLSVYISNKSAYKQGVKNIFSLSENKQYLLYMGNNIKIKRSTERIIEYLIDGVSVLCFNSELRPDKDLIMPTIDRGVLKFYLNEASGF